MAWQKKTGALTFDLDGPGACVGGSGTLLLEAGAFTLKFGDLRVNGNHLALSVSAETGVTVPSPAYINLSDWGGAFAAKVGNPRQSPGIF